MKSQFSVQQDNTTRLHRDPCSRSCSLNFSPSLQEQLRKLLTASTQRCAWHGTIRLIACANAGCRLKVTTTQRSTVAVQVPCTAPHFARCGLCGSLWLSCSWRLLGSNPRLAILASARRGDAPVAPWPLGRGCARKELLQGPSRLACALHLAPRHASPGGSFLIVGTCHNDWPSSIPLQSVLLSRGNADAVAGALKPVTGSTPGSGSSCKGCKNHRDAQNTEAHARPRRSPLRHRTAEASAISAAQCLCCWLCLATPAIFKEEAPMTHYPPLSASSLQLVGLGVQLRSGATTRCSN